MSWTPKNFDEACLRAAGRRAFNRRRHLTRAARISRILALQGQRDFTGRELSVLLHVHEATISRDLKFIEKVKADYQKDNFGASMRASSFRWLDKGRGYETTFEIRNGVRVK
jgi:predicted DNA-binding transcriptional regulator YafY